MIHYNGLMGGWITSPSFRAERRPIAFLGSFAFGKGLPKRPPCTSKFFMDSGAFSVWKSGKSIDLDFFISYLKEHAGILDVYAALDVIGDAEASFRNYVKMREAGLDPLPCFHIGEPLSWLDKYVAAGASYIGLGGIAQRAPDARHQFLRQVFQRYPDPTAVGFHGFGVASREFWASYPFRSCDSTTAVMHGASRTALTPFGTLEFRTASAHRRGPGLAVDRLRSWIELVGGDLTTAADPSPLGNYECGYLTAVALDEIAASIPPYTYKSTIRGFQL